jgi:hypothetical protein
MVGKSLFSPRDCYNIADKIVDMWYKYDLLLKFARMEDNEQMIGDFSGLVWELELLIEAYGFKEMVKIN